MDVLRSAGKPVLAMMAAEMKVWHYSYGIYQDDGPNQAGIGRLSCLGSYKDSQNRLFFSSMGKIVT